MSLVYSVRWYGQNSLRRPRRGGSGVGTETREGKIGKETDERGVRTLPNGKVNERTKSEGQRNWGGDQQGLQEAACSVSTEKLNVNPEGY